MIFEAANWLRLGAAVLVAYVAALVYLAFAGIGRSNFGGWLAASIVVALSPCLVPISAGPIRLFATFVAIATLCKLYDRHRQPNDFEFLPTLRARVDYLSNWFWLVLSRPPNLVQGNVDRRRLAWELPLALGTVALCVALFALDWSPYPFWLEHVAKAALLGIPVILSTNCLAMIWRLRGQRALDPMVAPWLARTPLDTWRRWNLPVQQLLYEHAFLPAGGLKRPVRALLWTFFVSGLIHEYVFGIATGRLQGWQLLFFSLQGVAAAATIRVRPRGWMVAPAIAATLTFNIATLAIFSMSVRQVVPFYASRVP